MAANAPRAHSLQKQNQDFGLFTSEVTMPGYDIIQGALLPC
jgi:hypothetical protein